ncbi:acyltransferase domain-containing protein [Streptomyces sp. M19]
MLAVAAAADVLAARIEGQEHRVSIAAVNGPEATVISGDADAVRAIGRRFREEGVKTKELAVSHAFHSPHMDPVLEEFRAAAATVAFAEPHTPSSPTSPASPRPWRNSPAPTTGPTTSGAPCASTTACARCAPTESPVPRTRPRRRPDRGGPGDPAARRRRRGRPDAAPVVAATLRAGRPEPETCATALGALHSGGAPWRSRGRAAPAYRTRRPRRCPPTRSSTAATG